VIYRFKQLNIPVDLTAGIIDINLCFTHEGKGDKCIFDVDKMVKKALTGF
jgi:hypothetical protein